MVSPNEPILPSSAVLQLLDEAHEQGFRAFLSSIGHDGNAISCRYEASRAASALNDIVNGRTGSEGYRDPYIAAQYLVDYHLGHCILAYWTFQSHFRNRVPDPLYICDVGSGTGAVRVGLALALSELSKRPQVSFDAVEPSSAFRDAGNFFWAAFRTAVRFSDFDYREFPDIDAVPALSGSAEAAWRVLTAFHLSLPYQGEWSSAGNAAQRSIQVALQKVSPNVEFYTCHSDKVGNLRRAIGVGRTPRLDSVAPSERTTELTSDFYSRCVNELGFRLGWSRRHAYRFAVHRKCRVLSYTS